MGTRGRALISRREAAFPYPHFGTMSVRRSVGWSNYHAMILQVNRSFSNGLQINSHYTWSKALDMAQSERRETDLPRREADISAWIFATTE